MSIEESIKLLERSIWDGQRMIDEHSLLTDEHGYKEFEDGINARKAILALLKTHPDNQPNEPLTLEELREMDGQPAWVKVIDHTVFADKADDFDGLGMVRKSWLRIWDGQRADLVKIDYHFEDYGKEWLAYRRPQKEDAL